MAELEDITMPVLRTYYTVGSVIYDIYATMEYMTTLLHHNDDESFPIARYDCIMADLRRVLHQPIANLDGFIVDPYNELLIERDVWFRDWGMEADLVDFIDDDTVETFECTMSDITSDNEECISSDDESEITETVRVLMEISRGEDEEYENLDI